MRRHKYSPKRMGRKWRKRIREALYQRDSGRCHHCGAQLTLSTPQLIGNATIEHLVPLRDGGTNQMDNLALTCNGDCGRYPSHYQAPLSLPTTSVNYAGTPTMENHVNEDDSDDVT